MLMHPESAALTGRHWLHIVYGHGLACSMRSSMHPMNVGLCRIYHDVLIHREALSHVARMDRHGPTTVTPTCLPTLLYDVLAFLCVCLSYGVTPIFTIAVVSCVVDCHMLYLVPTVCAWIPNATWGLSALGQQARTLFTR
jgi:hypothetical protein